MPARRLVTPVLTALVAGALALGWGQGPAPISATPIGGSCPLSAAQQLKSTKAWMKMMPVFRHPRCLNCHGGIPNPFPKRGEPAKRHMKVVDIDTTMRSFSTCENCHMKEWVMPAPFFFWTGRSDTELCSLMKNKFSAAKFVDHIRRDLGGTPFIDLAFKGERGLDEAGQAIYEGETGKTFRAEPPPGSHALLTQMAMDWVAAQGGSFVGDDECGCVIPDKGEVYQLDIQLKNTTGFEGILVTDSATMKIRIEDTTVTVFAITNFPSKATPEALTFPQGSITWIADPVGGINIVAATGEVALDFPVENTRMLRLEFAHSGTRAPEFERLLPRNVRQRFGGEAVGGFPRGTSFELVPGKKAYDNGSATDLPLRVRLTLLVPAQ